MSSLTLWLIIIIINLEQNIVASLLFQLQFQSLFYRKITMHISTDLLFQNRINLFFRTLNSVRANHYKHILSLMRVSPLLLILALATAVSALHLQALPPNPNTNPRPAPTPTPTPNYPTPTPTPNYPNPNPNPNNYPRPNPSPSPAPSGQVTANGVTFTFNGPFKYTCYYKDRPNEVYRWDSCYDINGCSLMIKDYMNCKGRIVKEQLPR